MVTGAALSLGGIVLQTIYGAAFPLNGVQISFFVPLVVIAVYVSVSLLTYREDFNMERMLHRGAYATGEQSVAAQEKQTWWQRLAGFDENFTVADKWIAGFVLGWTILWFVVFLIGTTWNLIAPWPLSTWSLFWEIVGIGIPIFLAVVVGIWFTWGGILDMRNLFRRLRTERVDHLDDGTVVNHQSLDEKAPEIIPAKF